MKRFCVIRAAASVMCAVLLFSVLSQGVTVKAAINEADIILLNMVRPVPVKTGYAPLDTLVNGILQTETNASMSNFEKVLACYDYVIKDASEQAGQFNSEEFNNIYNRNRYKSREDAIAIYTAYKFLQNKQGSANAFA